jgi:molybdopterin-guanine dinucleotide biosynthesis protein A
MRAAAKQDYWLFFAPIDLPVFPDNAVLSLILLAVGWQLKFLNTESR